MAACENALLLLGRYSERIQKSSDRSGKRTEGGVTISSAVDPLIAIRAKNCCGNVCCGQLRAGGGRIHIILGLSPREDSNWVLFGRFPQSCRCVSDCSPI